MPRQPRKKSNSGIYHVMLRGINKQVIFEDYEDSLKFLETLSKYKEICEYKILAYCIMKNHIHLLLKQEKEELDKIIKRIGSSYVYWYNLKYHRVGHLFQDRYKSEPVEDNSYLLTVLRFIHQNPVKAGVCKKVCDYALSNYNEYLNDSSKIIDKELVLSIMSNQDFINFNDEPTDCQCMDVDENDFKLNDNDAKVIVQKVSNCNSTAEFQTLHASQRDMIIKKLKHKGLSIRQISRLTGISIGVIRKVK